MNVLSCTLESAAIWIENGEKFGTNINSLTLLSKGSLKKHVATRRSKLCFYKVTGSFYPNETYTLNSHLNYIKILYHGTTQDFK